MLAENLLGAPQTAQEQGDAVHLTYVVTHRRVFRYRLYELGTRPYRGQGEMLAQYNLERGGLFRGLIFIVLVLRVTVVFVVTLIVIALTLFTNAFKS